MSLSYDLGAEPLEPLPESQDGFAVLTVIVLDDLPMWIQSVVEVTGLDGVLQDPPAQRRLAEVLLPLVTKEGELYTMLPTIHR